MELRKEIEQLEDVILSGFNFFSQTLLNETTLLNHLERIQRSIPREVSEAEDIVDRHDEILTHAHRLAEEIIANAEHRRSQLLNETGIIQEATEQADEIRGIAQEERREILQQAMTEAARVRREMDDYADQVLADLELRLDQSLNIIQASRDQLQNSSGEM